MVETIVFFSKDALLLARFRTFGSQAMLHQRFAPAAAAVAGKVYVCGGADATLRGIVVQRWVGTDTKGCKTNHNGQILGYHGISWDIMGYHGISWDIMGYHGISWDIMGYHGISGCRMDIVESNTIHSEDICCTGTCFSD